MSAGIGLVACEIGRPIAGSVGAIGAEAGALRTLLLERMTTPRATLERLAVREQQALVRILSRLLE